MEKLSRISTIIDKILKVVYWLLIVASTIVVLVFGLANLLPKSENVPMKETWTISLGNVALKLAENAAMNSQAIQMDMIATVVSIIVMTAFICYGIKLLRKILAPMIAKKPFDGTVSDNLKKLGWVIIIGSIALDITECITTHLVYSAFDLTNLLLSDKITDITIGYYVGSLTTLVIGMLMFLLSHVFRYGEQLQQQDDETL